MVCEGTCEVFVTVYLTFLAMCNYLQRLLTVNNQLVTSCDNMYLLATSRDDAHLLVTSPDGMYLLLTSFDDVHLLVRSADGMYQLVSSFDDVYLLVTSPDVYLLVTFSDGV